MDELLSKLINALLRKKQSSSIIFGEVDHDVSVDELLEAERCYRAADDEIGVIHTKMIDISSEQEKLWKPTQRTCRTRNSEDCKNDPKETARAIAAALCSKGVVNTIYTFEEIVDIIDKAMEDDFSKWYNSLPVNTLPEAEWAWPTVEIEKRPFELDRDTK